MVQLLQPVITAVIAPLRFATSWLSVRRVPPQPSAARIFSGSPVPQARGFRVSSGRISC
jgi:hypothetical protein